MKVFKYGVKAVSLGGQGCVRVDMPAGAKILSTAFIDRELFVWALVDPGAPAEPRSIRVTPTGHPIPDEVEPNLVFIGTALLPVDTMSDRSGWDRPEHSTHTLVFHVFEDISL